MIQRYWAVKHPDGWISYHTLAVTRDSARERHLIHATGRDSESPRISSQRWKDWSRKGYRFVRVQIRLEEK